MKEINIGAVVRTYNKIGGFEEMRYNHISCDNMPSEIRAALIAGELICVQLMSNAEAFYFKVPNDWPENWAELRSDSNKKNL